MNKLFNLSTRPHLISKKVIKKVNHYLNLRNTIKIYLKLIKTSFLKLELNR